MLPSQKTANALEPEIIAAFAASAKPGKFYTGGGAAKVIGEAIGRAPASVRHYLGWYFKQGFCSAFYRRFVALAGPRRTEFVENYHSRHGYCPAQLWLVQSDKKPAVSRDTKPEKKKDEQPAPHHEFYWGDRYRKAGIPEQHWAGMEGKRLRELNKPYDPFDYSRYG